MIPFDTALKAARKKAGLSQSKAAKLIEVPVKSLQNWEQGRNEPSNILQKVVLGVLGDHK